MPVVPAFPIGNGMIATPKKRISLKKGQVMLVVIVFFMSFALIISLGLINPIIKQFNLASDIWKSKESYYVSESGIEDVIFRIKNNMTVGSSENLVLNGFDVDTSITPTLDGKVLITESDRNGYTKKIETKIKEGEGISFNYGIQVGQGGFTMTGSSGIVGNVFSGGPIIGCSSCYINGSAIVSNSPNMIADQSNDTPESPSNSIIFGNIASTQDIAQSFKVSSTSALTQISLYMKKVGSPSDITVKIIKNNNVSPSSNANDIISSATLNSSLVTTNYDWVDVSLSPNPNLVVGTTYWIVLDGSTGNTSKKYIIGANLDSSYISGTSKTGSLGGSWTNTGYDTYFRIYLGGIFGMIKGESRYNQVNVGTIASDIVWAHNVSYVESSGPIRCQSELYNNKSCDQSYSDPAPASYPISDGNITAWKDEAILGGSTTGDYNRTNSTPVSLGPQKIVGNMHIGGSVILTVTGTLYITGDLIIDGSGIVKLSSSYGTNSGVIIVDGRVVIGRSAKAKGSGQSGSYITIISNSTCPVGSCSSMPAIDMSGSGGSVILNAQKGTINFSGSANANSATANMITMSGETVINYQSGIANINFSSGPSGGFNIESWRQLEQ
ncbi:MAG: hypothetical protein NTU76_04075 [Candidatus Taylorbacteria bacterium]|nr:hypothetical protein [Candidatus Taylorbacteria bacterium]